MQENVRQGDIIREREKWKEEREGIEKEREWWKEKRDEKWETDRERVRTKDGESWIGWY